MKRRYFSSVCMITCCGLLWLSGCQGQADSPALSAADGARDFSGTAPKITFARSGHDFGEVPPNKTYKGEIEFTNTGKSTLRITKVSQCCGVVTRLAGDKKEYAPGESGTVLIEWTSGSQPTTLKREFFVHSNDPATPAGKLKIQARTVLKVTWEPKRLRLALDEDNAGDRKITIRCLDNRPFSIVSFESSENCMTADFDPSVEATEFVLELKVSREKLHRNLKGLITVGLTHPDSEAAIVFFDVLPKYTINPPLVIVSNAEPNKPSVRRISVVNNYGKDFGIVSLSSKNGIVGAKVLNKREITNGHELEVELTPPSSEGMTKALDELYLTLEDGEKLTIKCNVFYKREKGAYIYREGKYIWRPGKN